MVEIEPKILTVSDVHLGALKSNTELFTKFLNDILDDNFGKDLQVLVILGDFLDLCISLPKILLENKIIQEILNLLLEVKKKVNLIYVLGNHEIPITSNIFTGTYDEKFEKRKTKFLKKFKNTIIEELFPSDIVCQYIVLKNVNGKDKLLLYNSQDQISNNSPLNQMRVDGLDLDSDYECLLLHGYQFDSDVYRLFTGQMWKSLISYHNSEVKETFNYFWNEIIKGNRKIKPITFDIMKTELVELKNLSPDTIDSIFLNLNNLEFNLIKANMRVMKKWERSREYNYYLKGIAEFLDEADCDLSNVSQIIYGHSHMKRVTTEIIEEHKLEIINDGAWQHSHPTYAEIINKGKINLKSMNSK
ncbi:MAG: metallophosphoesterase [Promethearchaeota archaeon]|jgi:UDP-2,3-diacylglucosamine pyrophosphatase LpxH